MLDSTFFRVVVVREREREKRKRFLRPARQKHADDERHYWVHHHPGKGRGSLQTIQRPLSPFLQRTSHLKGVVLLVRPHPPREEEEKIVVAVLRATCRSMMMTVLIKGFVSSTDDDDTRRRRKRMETQTALRRRVPPPQFSFLGFYKTLIKP